MLREFWLLTGKPLMVVVNVAEVRRAGAGARGDRRARALAGGDAIAVSARIENDIAELDPADRAGFLHDLGLEEPGLYRVARSAYRLLRLITFFTAGDTEVRAWNLREGETALDAAASIHTDIARGFIRAEVTDAEELLDAGLVRGAARARQAAARGSRLRDARRRRHPRALQCLTRAPSRSPVSASS